MPSQSPRVFLSSFDPAVHLHSEPSEVALPQAGYADDVEALNVVQQEHRINDGKKGVVIQHRTWNLHEVFQSEDGGWLGGY